MDAGWRGAWGTTLSTAGGGTEGGGAVLARAHTQVTQAPLPDGGAVVHGRALAAHVRAAMKGGMIVIS
eukprot:7654774-Pyramimonas_sp.AAC.1